VHTESHECVLYAGMKNVTIVVFQMPNVDVCECICDSKQVLNRALTNSVFTEMNIQNLKHNVVTDHFFHIFSFLFFKSTLIPKVITYIKSSHLSVIKIAMLICFTMQKCSP